MPRKVVRESVEPEIHLKIEISMICQKFLQTVIHEHFEPSEIIQSVRLMLIGRIE